VAARLLLSSGAQARVVKNGTSPRALPIQGGQLQPIFMLALRFGHSLGLRERRYVQDPDCSTVS
jgi:hypothetical protein